MLDLKMLLQPVFATDQNPARYPPLNLHWQDLPTLYLMIPLPRTDELTLFEPAHIIFSHLPVYLTIPQLPQVRQLHNRRINWPRQKFMRMQTDYCSTAYNYNRVVYQSRGWEH